MSGQLVALKVTTPSSIIKVSLFARVKLMEYFPYGEVTYFLPQVRTKGAKEQTISTKLSDLISLTSVSKVELAF